MFRRCLAPALLIFAGLGVWLGLQWLENDASIQPYSLIEENLYAGGSVKAPPPGTKTVLNLCQFEDSYQAGDPPGRTH